MPRPSRCSSAGSRGACSRSRTAARAACRTSWRRPRGCPDGTPFPTLYYLTCPRAVAAVSRLEAGGLMREMTRRAGGRAGLRHGLPGGAPRLPGPAGRGGRAAGVAPLPPGTPSAGGMPDRVKCLHALVAHELAVPGANPLGGEAALAAGDWWAAGPCVAPDRLREPGPAAGPRRGGRLRHQLAAAAHRRCGPRGGPARRLDRRMEIVRLGQGVDATGRLAPEALARTFRALRSTPARSGAPRPSASGWSRRARPGTPRTPPSSSRGVTGILGVAPEVLSGDEEARLSFTGATAELARPPPERSAEPAVPARLSGSLSPRRPTWWWT